MPLEEQFETVDVLNKPVAAPVAPPAPPAKPMNYLLDLGKHGLVTTQEYADETKRDQMFHYYEQRGHACRARNKVAPKTVVEAEARAQ